MQSKESLHLNTLLLSLAIDFQSSSSNFRPFLLGAECKDIHWRFPVSDCKAGFLLGKFLDYDNLFHMLIKEMQHRMQRCHREHGVT